MGNIETYTLYGVKAQTIDEAAKLVERILGVQFQRRNSLHMGGNYYKYRDRTNSRSMILKGNNTEDLNELDEEDFPQHKILLYVENVPSDALFNVALTNAPNFFEKLRVRYR